MDADIKYFKDADSPSVILIRKRRDMFELEYITEDNHNWQKTSKNHPYEREFYLGQGNNSLFPITLDEAKKIMKADGVQQAEKSVKINITTTNGANAEDISDAIGEFLKNVK